MTKPLHFRAITGAFSGNEHMKPFGLAKDTEEPFEHSARSANHPKPQLAIGLVKPSSQPDSSGDTVQFADGKTRFCQETIRAQDTRDFITEGGGALQFDEMGRLALIQ